MHSIFFVLLLAPSIFANPFIVDDVVDYAIPSGSCGRTRYNPAALVVPQPFIVGGQTALENAYPWQVSLNMRGSHMCGGTIIGPQHILTAAHCFSAGGIASYWTVLAGKHSLLKTETNQKTYKVTSITRHESYSALTNANDVAVIKLAEKIAYNEYIQPACLPDANVGDLVGVEAIATGWGATREGGSVATLLQEVKVPVITNDKCQQKYPEENIISGMLCAGYDAGGKDACQGDSGGPLVRQKDGSAELIGVTSWGYGCAQRNRPGVYTRVSYYLNWIKSKMI